MATHLDLEEQEQLDQLKHFWAKYGNLISWAAIAVLVAMAAWNGWNWWQRSEAEKASAMYDELERAVVSDDAARVEAAFGQMKERLSGNVVAAQGGLLVAKSLLGHGKPEQAREALQWVSDNAPDAGFRSVAALRMSAIDMQAKDYDKALGLLGDSIAEDFKALAADRRGDIYMAQGKTEEAKAEYEKAWSLFGDRADYRRLVKIKLNALGVEPAEGKANAS
ncbi:tetratricopeptide repeat protein [Hydrogenophaga sp. 5NK40-0174]|uniref:YfgM family protein n=1 Tax=Hydrogenophaga sp. 5NK40-0174 TaxID=3127649 RepID=UPI003108BE9D